MNSLSSDKMDASLSTSLFSDRCEELRDVSVVNLLISIFIVIGMLVSYLPQHIRIIRRRSSEGISPYFVLLGTTSATSAFANILLLPKSRQDVACCKELETFHCVAGLLGIAQLGVQWASFTFIFILFLVFFPYNKGGICDLEGERDEDQPNWQTALLVAALTILHGLAVIVISCVLSTLERDYLAVWADMLGVMAAILAAIQYVPQIWTTYHLKHVGSLSIPMMCMQTPGGYLFATSLFLRLGWAGWSSWGIFVLTATMQGILLCLAIYYEIQAARLDRPGSPEPLLSHDSGPHSNGNNSDDRSPPQISSASDPNVTSRPSEPATDTTPLLRRPRSGNSHQNYNTNRG